MRGRKFVARITDETRRELGEKVRELLVEAAIAGWEEASLAGLCNEGAFEVAVGRMQGVDLGAVMDVTTLDPDEAKAR